MSSSPRAQKAESARPTKEPTPTPNDPAQPADESVVVKELTQAMLIQIAKENQKLLPQIIEKIEYLDTHSSEARSYWHPSH